MVLIPGLLILLLDVLVIAHIVKHHRNDGRWMRGPQGVDVGPQAADEGRTFR